MKQLTTTLAVVTALSLTTAAQVRDTRPATPPAPQQPARDAAAPAAGKGVLAGTVMTDEQTPQPLKRAQITVMNTDASLTRTTFTSETGKFTIAGLPAGRYTLSANKPPYLRMNYGARRHDRPGTPITLKDAEQMTNLTVRMTRGAVLSGTVTDENGAPASGVTVRALQLRVQNGERTFVTFAASGTTFDTTDDRGMYRFFGLPPGEYTVTAQPRLTSGEVKAMTDSEIRAILQALAQQTAQTPGTGTPAPQPPPRQDVEATTVAYANVFYPGSTVATSASTVTIGAGEERRGVDFALKLVRTARVEGVVVPPPGVPPQAVQIMMMPVAAAGPAVSGAAIELMAMNRVSPGADGKFQFTGVPPGAYTISARASGPGTAPPGAPPPPPPPPPPPGGGQVIGFTRTVTSVGGAEAMTMDFIGPAYAGGGPMFWGQADVSVDGSTVSGVSISMQPGMTLTGKLQFKGSRLVPEGDLSRVRLTLAPAAGAGGALRINMGGLPGATVEPDGKFKFTGVTPGRYRVTGIAPLPVGSAPGLSWTLQSVIVKGRDVLDFQLEIGPNDELGEMVVTFGDATQEVNGTLQDPTGRPAPDYTIIVFAADQTFWTTPTRRVRSARPGTDGKFTVTNLPPGEYRVAAVVDVAPTEINDPLYLEQLVAASVRITLAEGQKLTQDLKISGGL